MPKTITAAQARLNFCPKLFSETFIRINEMILEASRLKHEVELAVPTEDGTHIDVRKALEENGFKVNMTRIDSKTFNMRIEW